MLCSLAGLSHKEQGISHLEMGIEQFVRYKDCPLTRSSK